MLRATFKVTSKIWTFVQPKLTKLFSKKYLLVTNTGITISLSGTGDILQQNYEMLCKRQTKWNLTRTRRICSTGAVIGPCCHYWYLFLDRFLPGRTLKIVMKKILMDQVVFSPVNVTVFLVILSSFEGESVMNELQEKGAQLLLAEWIIWPPLQLVNFLFLPTKYRLLYDNTVSLGLDYYYSYIKYRQGKTDSEVDSERNYDPDKVMSPSHHLGSTCSKLQRLRSVDKLISDSSKCSSDFD